MASESKKSFPPMLIYCNGIIFHLGFKDSGFSPPLIHLGNIKNVDFCPICPPPTFITPPHFDRLNAHRPNSKIMHLVLNYAFGFEASVVCISMTCSYSL